MATIKKFYIDDIARQTQEMLERASQKHKSVNGFCIFIEGDHYHVIIPEYESEQEEDKQTRRLMKVLLDNPKICRAFAQFVVPPARFFEREAKKSATKKRLR